MTEPEGPRTPRPDTEPKPEPKPEPPAAATRARGRAARSLEDQIEQFFASVSVAIGVTGDLHCAGIVADNARPLAEAWGRLARQNPRVRRIIESMFGASTWGEVVFVTAGVVIPIAQHHNLIPADAPTPFSFGMGNGSPPPSEEVREHEQQRGDDPPRPMG